MTSPRGKFGVMPMSECSQSPRKATTLQAWGKVDMQEGLSSQRNWPRAPAERNVLLFLQKGRSKGLHKQEEQSGTRSALSRAVGPRTGTAQCSLFHSLLQSSTFRRRLSPPLLLLSNYTIYSFSTVISSHLYSPERSQDNHHGE